MEVFSRILTMFDYFHNFVVVPYHSHSSRFDGIHFFANNFLVSYEKIKRYLK